MPLMLETEKDPSELLPLVGAQLRASPLHNSLAAYIDRAGRLQVVRRAGPRGIHREHETVVDDMVARLITEADEAP